MGSYAENLYRNSFVWRGIKGTQLLFETNVLKRRGIQTARMA